MNWIKTSDRMPEQDVRVLIWIPGSAVVVAELWEYRGRDVFWDDDMGVLEATHWQSLPEPPAE